MALHTLCSVLDDKKSALLIDKINSFDAWTIVTTPATATAPGTRNQLSAAQLFRVGERLVKETLEEDRPLVLPSFLRDPEKAPNTGKPRNNDGKTTPRAKDEVPTCRNHARGYPCSIQPCPFGPPGHKSHKDQCSRGGTCFAACTRGPTCRFERRVIAFSASTPTRNTPQDPAPNVGARGLRAELVDSRPPTTRSAASATRDDSSSSPTSPPPAALPGSESPPSTSFPPAAPTAFALAHKPLPGAASEAVPPRETIDANHPRLYLDDDGEWSHAFTSSNNIDPCGPCVIFDTGATGDGMLLVPNPTSWGQSCDAVRVNTANGSATVDRRASIKLDVSRGRYMHLHPLVAFAAVKHPVLLVPGHRLRSCHLSTDGFYA